MKLVLIVIFATTKINCLPRTDDKKLLSGPIQSST